MKIILLGEKSWNIFPGFDLSTISLYTLEAFDISRANISVPSLAGWLARAGSSISRPIVLLFTAAGLSLPLVYPDDDRHRYACVPAREKSGGISESDFERFVCVEVARRPAPFGAKLLRSERGKPSRTTNLVFSRLRICRLISVFQSKTQRNFYQTLECINCHSC